MANLEMSSDGHKVSSRISFLAFHLPYSVVLYGTVYQVPFFSSGFCRLSCMMYCKSLLFMVIGYERSMKRKKIVDYKQC